MKRLPLRTLKAVIIKAPVSSLELSCSAFVSTVSFLIDFSREFFLVSCSSAADGRRRRKSAWELRNFSCFAPAFKIQRSSTSKSYIYLSMRKICKNQSIIARRVSGAIKSFDCKHLLLGLGNFQATTSCSTSEPLREYFHKYQTSIKKNFRFLHIHIFPQ